MGQKRTKVQTIGWKLHIEVILLVLIWNYFFFFKNISLDSFAKPHIFIFLLTLDVSFFFAFVLFIACNRQANILKIKTEKKLRFNSSRIVCSVEQWDSCFVWFQVSFKSLTCQLVALNNNQLKEFFFVLKKKTKN